MIEPVVGIRLVLITLSLSLTIFMNVLDISIANVAIPTIAGDLAVSPDQGTWVITSFAVSQAIMLPLTGWLARRFGEVRLFIWATLLFTLMSACCGLASNLPMLVFFRVCQGIAAGPMIPLSQSLLLANYPPHRKAFATSLWAMVAVVGPIFGPILGGWITDNYTWPWIFYINLPIGLIATAITWSLLKNQETLIRKSPIDVVGLVLLIVGVGCLQIMLDKGNDLDWFHSSFIVSLAIVSGIALVCLLIWELTESHPIIDLSLFGGRNFCLGTIALTFGYLTFFANVVVFPLWLQTQMAYTPTWAGLAAAPVGFIPFILTPFVGMYMHKLDLRLIISFGFLIFAYTSFWMASFNVGIDFWQLIGPRFVQGLGITCFFTPLISIVISGLAPERIASALGLANFCRILGGSFGTSISITLWNRREAFHQSRLVEQITVFNPQQHGVLKQLQAMGFSSLEKMSELLSLISHQAFMLATNDIFWLSGYVFLSLIIVIWFTKPPFLASGSAVAAE